MKRTTEKRGTGGALPDFLDQEPGGEATGGALPDRDDTGSDGPHPGSATDPDESIEPAGEDEFAAEATDENSGLAGETGDEPAAPTARGSGRNTRRAAAQRAAVNGGSLATGLGVAALLAAVSLSFWPAAATALAARGIEVQGLLAIGVVLAVGGLLRRHIGRVAQQLDDELAARQQGSEDLLDGVRQILAEHSQGSLVAAEGSDLQHVLLALQRQDEKINNLTRAIKMYGKPLMEIAGQATELVGGVAQLRMLVEGGAEASRQRALRFESQLKTAAERTSNLGDLPQQVARIETHLGEMGARLENGELAQMVSRLAETAGGLQRELQQLARGDGVQQIAKSLETRLDSATRSLADGIKQLRDGNLGGLETAVRDVQRGITGLATAMAQLQVTVKAGTRPATTAAPTPAEPAPDTAPASPPVPAAAQTAAATGYQTGKRTVGAGNVLGAIAKLRRMKN